MQNKEVLSFMKYELEGSKLEVDLVEAPESKHHNHKVRIVQRENPWWYKKLCEKYPSSRKDNRLGTKLQRTKIKRQGILSILNKLVNNEKCTSIYKEDLLDLANEVNAKWELEEKEWGKYE